MCKLHQRFPNAVEFTVEDTCGICEAMFNVSIQIKYFKGLYYKRVEISTSQNLHSAAIRFLQSTSLPISYSIVVLLILQKASSSMMMFLSFLASFSATSLTSTPLCVDDFPNHLRTDQARAGRFKCCLLGFRTIWQFNFFNLHNFPLKMLWMVCPYLFQFILLF